MWEQTDGRDWMLTWFFFVHHTWDLFAECHPLNRWSQVDHITPADDEKIKPFDLSHPCLNGCSHYRRIYPIQTFTILFPGAYLSISNHPDSTAKVLLFSVDFQEETAMATFPKFHTKAAQKRWRIDASPLPQTRRSANSRCSPPVVEKHRFTPHEWFHLLFQEGRYMYLNKNIYNIIYLYDICIYVHF